MRVLTENFLPVCIALLFTCDDNIGWSEAMIHLHWHKGKGELEENRTVNEDVGPIEFFEMGEVCKKLLELRQRKSHVERNAYVTRDMLLFPQQDLQRDV